MLKQLIGRLGCKQFHTKCSSTLYDLGAEIKDLAARDQITMAGYFTAVVNMCDTSRDFHESVT